MRKNFWQSFFILILLLILFIALEIISCKSESLTYDETQNFKIGYTALTKRDYTIDPLAQPFISQLSALPYLFDNRRLLNNNLYPSERLFWGRLVIIFLAAITGITIFFLTQQFFNLKTSLLATIFFLFEPTIFSHSHYITFDIGFTLIFLITYWFLLLLFNKPNFKILSLTGLTTGLLFAAKISGIGLFILSSVMLSLFFKKNLKYFFSIKRLFLFFLLIILGIWFTYQFSFDSLGGFTEEGLRKSNILEEKLRVINPKMADLFRKLLNLPLPLGSFLRIVKNTFVYNLSLKRSFFLGEIKTFPSRFFLILLFLKTPIPLIIFFLMVLIFLIKRRKQLVILLIPLIAMLILVMTAKINLWIRYLLPIYPFMAIIAAYGFERGFVKLPVFRVPMILLLIWFFLCFFKSLPQTITFANEISFLFGKPYLVFSDSNLDWGQGLITLKEYVKKENIGEVKLSYFGTDNPNEYGFLGFVFGNLCKRSCSLETTYPDFSKNEKKITALSITNWQECGWYKTEMYSPEKIKDVVGGSILIFK